MNRENPNISSIASMLEWLIDYQELRVNDSDDITLKKYILNEEAIPKNTEELFKA